MTITSARRPPRGARVAVPLAIAAVALAACANPGSDADPAAGPSTTSDPSISEEAAHVPRLALTYDGGIQVLDATTLEVVADTPLAGFTRLNPAGDERHLLASTTGGFQVLDVGVWAEPHGDHAHYYSADPALLDLLYPAEVPGHVVVHDGRTVLFDDGTGQVTVVDSAAVADPDAELTEYTTPTAHHGVAVALEDGSLVVTEGTADARTGIRVLGADGEVVAGSDDCPGVHGETVAGHDTVLVGCEDGVLVYADGEITKIDSPDEFGRIGNLRGTHDSDVVLGDYNADPDGGPLTQVALVDISTSEMTLVDLGTEYTFRSLARDESGDALVLGTDGHIHVIDPATAEVERTIAVIDAWEVPAEWQEPRPTLLMLDGSAYVTDPANQQLLAVDIETGEVWQQTTLEVTPNEIAGVTGDVVEGVSGEHGDDGH